MKQSYKLILIFILFFAQALQANPVSILGIELTKNKIVAVNATITGSNTACLNGTQPQITFTGSGGTAPYTFIYKINNGANLTVSTTTGNSVVVNAPTSTVGVFTYTLISVTEDGGIPVNIGDAINVTVIDNFSISAGANLIVCKGNAINLTSTLSSNAPNSGVSISWVGPNNYSSNSANPVRNNSNSSMSGDYTVTASIGGCQVTDIVNVIVLEPTVSSANLQLYQGAQWLVSCTQPGETSGLIFLNNGVASNLQSWFSNYTINWGDGSPSFTSNSSIWNSGNNINHTYNVGLYQLTISSNTTSGCTISKSYNVFVGNQPASPQIQLPINAQGCVPFELTFPISGVSANIEGTTYIITFSDDPGNPITYNQLDIPSSITRVFNSSSCGNTFTNGNTTENNAYGVSMQAINPCGSASSSAGPIRTSTPPTAIITAPTNGCTNQTIIISDESLNGSIVTAITCNSNSGRYWEISPSTGWTLSGSSLGNDGGFPGNFAGWNNGTQNLNVQFSVPGIYTFTLNRRNSCLGTSSVTKTICVEAPLTSASFTLNNTVGCGALTAQATNSTPTASACNVTYNWAVNYTASNCGTSPGNSYNYFTGGTTNTSANPSFNFPNPGTYTVTLTAHNSCGNQTATQTVTVKAPPTVAIASIANICGGTSATISPTATVTNCATQTPLTYVWSFIGGTPSSYTGVVPPAISYTTAGSYTVSLAVTNECGTTTDTETFTVTPGVTANAGTDETLCAGETVQLTGSGTAGVGATINYSWLPSAGLSNANIANPTANPSVTTTYTLTVSTGNGSSACTATDQVIVYRNTINPGAIASDQTVCSGTDPSAFTVAAAATGAGTITYQWESSTANATSGYSDIFGATLATYDPPVLTQNTWYRRKVTSTLNGEACTVTGNFVSIYINTITAGTIGSDQQICSGGDPTALSGTAATGGGTISYQWQSSVDNSTFTNLAGATVANYNPPILTQNTWYRRVDTSTINGVSCSSFTNIAAISLTNPPVISQNPLATQTLCAGGTASALTITATGGTALTYQWYASTANNNTTGTAISSATAATYTPLTTTVGTTYYYCVVSTGVSGCNTASATAQVTVIAAPIVTSQPQSQTLCEGQSPAQLSIAYQNGTGTPVYQWYSNTANSTAGGTAISGATTTTYLPPSTMGTLYYYAVITFPGGGCSVLTTSAAAIVLNQKPVITSNEIATICSVDTFSITPGTIGNTIPTGTQYTWTVPANANITGEANQTTPQNGIGQTLVNTTNAPVTAVYTVTPVANGCSGLPFSVTITVNPKPSVTAQTATTCSEGTFTITPANGSGNIVPAGTTYSWGMPVVSPGVAGGLPGTDAVAISGTLTNNTNTIQTATYTVTPKWTSGSQACTGNTFTVTVTVNPKPVISNITQNSCSGTSFIITPADVVNGTVPSGTVYSWAVPTGPAGVSGLMAGTNSATISGTITNTTTATVTITYVVTPIANGCTGSSFDVTLTVAPTPTVAAVNSQTVCNQSATAAINFTGTITATIFNWTNSTTSIGLATSGSGSIPTFTALNSGTTPVTATVTVTPEINGCNGVPQNFTITVNPAPSVIFSQTGQTICSGSATTTVNLSSATPNTTISWTATQPAGITGVATSGTTSIPVQTLVNTTNAPITVTYTASATTSDLSACPGATTAYSITVTPVPFVNGTPQISTCSGTALNYIPSNAGGNNMPAGVTFTWTAPTGSGFTGGSAQSTPQTSLNPTLVNTTNTAVIATYTITPHYNGCNGVPFNVAVTINPTAVIPNGSITLCSGTTFSFDPATTATIFPNGTVFNWNAPTGTITGGTAGTAQSIVTGTLNNATASVQTATYTITPVSPQGNCNGASFTLTVTVNPVFTVTHTVSNYNGFQISSAGANDAFINLSPTGGTGSYTYSWTGPNGFTASSQNVANLGPGAYTVVIADGLCSTISITVLIAEPMPLVIAEVTASHVNVNCFGQSTGVVEVAVTTVSIAPFDYAILLPDGTVVENVDNLTALNYVFDNLPAGTYNIRVTDANGTIKYINGVEVTQPATGLAISSSIISNFNGFSISCNGANNGSINLTVAGGYPTYTYSWTGPNGFTATTEDIAALAPGVYTVTILDTTNACPLTQNFTITEPQPVTFTGAMSAFNGYQISCFGGTNGSINITPSGGTSVYTYAWTGPNGFTASTQNLSGLSIGTYAVTMADNNGCSAPAQSFTLTQPTALAISQTHVNVLCFGAATGAIDVTVTGGIANGSGSYTFAWTGPNGFTASSEDVATIVAGVYNLVVTDANGCTLPLSVSVTQQPEIIITPTTTPITCYGANNASISLNIIGGNPPYTADWSNLATGTYQDNLAAGIYTITVTDASNCVKVVAIPIPEAPVFKVEPVFANVSCHGAHDGSITLNLTGGIAPVTLVWSDGSTAGTQRNNLGPGTYTATITDGTPCQIIRTFTIIEPAALTVAANLTHALDCNDTTSGAIDLLVAGGTLPYTYNWSNGQTIEDLSAITSGTYSVTITDASGCSVSGTYTITRPAPLVLNVTSNVVHNCDTHYVRQTNTAQAAGGVPPFQYTWSSGTVSGAFGQLMNTDQNGTVIVTATDSKGCTATSTFEVQTEQLGEANFTAGSYAFTTYQEYSIADPVQFDNLSTGDYSEVGWDFGDGGSSSEISPSHTYLNEGTYTVTLHVVYPYGCSDTYRITLVVTKGYDVMVPNAFTPNADGMNDTFKAVHRGLKSIELNVFDTWGALLYSEKGEVITGWSGYIKGNPSENGNFYYRIKAETFYGQVIEFNGPFVLIK